MDPVTGTTFDEAIHLIEDFVGQTEGTTDPLGVQELFRRTVYQDVDIRTGSGGLKKRFVVHTDGGLQPPGITASVREAMRKALQAVEGRQLSSEGALAVKQVKTQLAILNEMEPVPERPEERAPPQSPAQTVQQVKEGVKAKEDSPIKSPLFAVYACVLWGGVAGFISLICSHLAFTAIAGVSVAFGAGLAVIAGIGTLVMLGLVVCAGYALIHRVVVGRQFDEAKTFEQVYPIFEDLTPEAKSSFLVKLGPEFRKGFLDWLKKEGDKDTNTRAICIFIDNMTSPSVPEDLKKEYYKQSYSRLRSFTDGVGPLEPSLRQVLEEEGYAKKEWQGML